MAETGFCGCSAREFRARFPTFEKLNFCGGLAVALRILQAESAENRFISRTTELAFSFSQHPKILG
ncbi:MAG: hypothetical protein K2X27_16475 [Candidatus Obscuribacterales bacterium]|nr:hypothetical protein [Candidatus Obscuribacterales bacterium]